MLLFALYSNINIKSLVQVAYITVGGCDTNIFQLFSVFFPVHILCYACLIVCENHCKLCSDFQLSHRL